MHSKKTLMDKSQLTFVVSRKRKFKNKTTHKELDSSPFLKIRYEYNNFVKVAEENFVKHYEVNHTQQLLNRFDNFGK